ncbi:MAG TPA: IPT/TIG domain-containing protein [Solirubrobacterales bacterium]|nr:IPT/TIG domain-containing protein [Solirubrobacterales bacterium]
MGVLRRLLVLFAAALACGVLAASASAKVVTVGSPLTNTFVELACSGCTVIPTEFEGSAALVSSPVTGAVIRWRILQAAPPFQYRLRVANRLGLATFAGAGASSLATPLGSGLEAFPAQIPIQAGQYIGLDLQSGAPIGFVAGAPLLTAGAGTTSTFAAFEEPILGEGEARTTAFGELEGGEIAFNADIQPAPTVTGFFPFAGPISGGTAVTIQGTDLTGATSVTFGGTPAASYRVDSESQITAITPPLPNPGTGAIRVTTVAGSAAAPAAFAVVACTVPTLKGKHLKAAKKRIRRAGCSVGKVTKTKGATSKTGKVRKQSPKPGTKVPLGVKVRVVLGP